MKQKFFITTLLLAFGTSVFAYRDSVGSDNGDGGMSFLIFLGLMIVVGIAGGLYNLFNKKK